jgi:hypothetical protein
VTDSINLNDLPYEHLIGLITIGSSSLDHVVRLLHRVTMQELTGEGASEGPWDLLDSGKARKNLGRECRDTWRQWAELNRMGMPSMDAASDWMKEALNLLDRRDRVVHALWELDPSIPEGIRGQHLRSNQTTVDHAGMVRLASDIREHMAEPVAGPVFRSVFDVRLGR